MKNIILCLYQDNMNLDGNFGGLGSEVVSNLEITGKGTINPPFTDDDDIINKKYVDDAIISGGGAQPNPGVDILPVQRGGIFVDSSIRNSLSGDIQLQSTNLPNQSMGVLFSTGFNSIKSFDTNTPNGFGQLNLEGNRISLGPGPVISSNTDFEDSQTLVTKGFVETILPDQNVNVGSNVDFNRISNLTQIQGTNIEVGAAGILRFFAQQMDINSATISTNSVITTDQPLTLKNQLTTKNQVEKLIGEIVPLITKVDRRVFRFNPSGDAVLYEDNNIRVDWILADLQPSFVLKTLPQGVGNFPNWIDTAFSITTGNVMTSGNGDSTASLNTKVFFNGETTQNILLNFSNYGASADLKLIAENDVNYPYYKINVHVGDITRFGICILEVL